MGKGKRASFDRFSPPLSSSDLISAKLPLDQDHLHSSIFPPTVGALGNSLLPADLKQSSSPSPSTSSTTLTAISSAASSTSSLPGSPLLGKKDHNLLLHAADGASASAKRPNDEEHILETAPYAVLITTYISYAILIVFGHIRDFFGFRFRKERYREIKNQNGYAAISSGFDTFYQRRLYARIRDVFNRPTTKVPGRTVTLLERESKDQNRTFKLTGTTREVLNLSSYNYLGFAQNEGPCADAVEAAIRKHGISTCSPRMEVGSTELQLQTEALVARFIGVEAAVITSMGFATNSTTLPALVGKGCLVISDSLNHASLVYGVRVSRATVRVYKHNDAKDLEAVLRESIAQGQPRTHRPWKKILVVMEGLYSMEGSIGNLPEIVELKKKYNFYIFLDEAHSIGAMGPNGRGVCDYHGIDPKDIDVMMGTFTKSFGAAGGYIAGKKDLVDYIRLHAHSSIYAESITAPILQQIYTSMRIIMGEEGGDDGRRRIQILARNSRFFSTELKKMGFIVYGDPASPVVPLLLFHPAKIPAFSRELLQRGVAVVVVGYPATPIITSRVRFCISAAHTMEDLKYALKVIGEVGERLCLKVSRVKRGADGEIIGNVGVSWF